MTQIIIYLLQTAFGIYTLLFLLRFTLQLTGADFYNPHTQAITKFTNHLVMPLQRILPAAGKFSLASFIVIVLLNSVLFAAIVWLLFGVIPIITQLLAWALIAIVAQLLDIFFFAVIGVVILSWIAPHSRHPAAILLFQVTQPIMAPVRRIIPSIGGLDLSPILLIVGINLLNMVIVSPIAQVLKVPNGIVWGV